MVLQARSQEGHELLQVLVEVGAGREREGPGREHGLLVHARAAVRHGQHLEQRAHDLIDTDTHTQRLSGI